LLTLAQLSSGLLLKSLRRLISSCDISNSPDKFYLEKDTNLTGIKRWMYQRVIRHLINKNVAHIRNKLIVDIDNV
jgi:hypothetical protein